MITVLIWFGYIVLGIYILVVVCSLLTLLIMAWPNIKQARKARKARHKELMRRD